MALAGMNVMAKSLVELCDPLFQYVCRLNRLARKGGMVDQGQLRAELKSLLIDTRNACESVPGMGLHTGQPPVHGPAWVEHQELAVPQP